MKATIETIKEHALLTEALKHCPEFMEELDIPDELYETYVNMVMNYESLIERAEG